MKDFKKQVIKYISRILILLCSAGIMLVIFTILTRDSREIKNALELNFDQYNKIKPETIGYRQIKEFSIRRDHLFAIAIDPFDNIFVSADQSIIKYDREGNEQISFAVTDQVLCMAFDQTGKLYAASKNSVTSYGESGINQKILISLSDKTIITSIAVANENIFVADAGNKLVHIYNMDGKLKKSIGDKEHNNGIPWFIVPSPYFDLAVDNKNKLWVVNPGKHELDQYTLEGELISSWGIASANLEGFCGCCNPIHFALTSDDQFITSEKGLVRVKEYNEIGVFQTVVAGPDSFEDSYVRLDLAVDSNNRVLVLDNASGNVKIFERNNEDL
ncbi:MAG: hypothetical protein HQ510_04775 [Candidatus Marinimicrobia bacterium]|nr:hypothetical protein [Candidatus Neomarinimicrobiota bacterium]